MIGTAKFFCLIFINYFVCSTPNKWNLTNSANNVQLFGQFINDIIKSYDHQEGRDFTNETGSDQEERDFTNETRRHQFYIAFAKHVSEIAHFRVINSNPEDNCANLKVGFGASAFKYCGKFKRMEQHIANEFKNNILCPEKPLPRAVVDQLLMLTFSFAVRLLMSFEFINYSLYNQSIGKWQMKTLLSAFKLLSTKSDTNGGIFPFKIIQIPENISEYTVEHNQYIENFKFVLKLSDFSLTSFEVYKLLETILIDAERMDDKSNVRAAEQQPPALYTFVKQYFVENLRKRTLKHFRPTSNEKLLHYALVFFGVELHVRVMFNYSDFTDYYYDKRKECKDDYNFDLDIHKNMYVALKLEIFNEPLANYTSVIQIQQCKEVTQFAFALRKIVVDIGMNLDKNNDYSIHDGPLFKLNEFKFLLKILANLSDKENEEKLTHFEGTKTEEFLSLLDQIVEEYSCTTACKFEWNLKEFWENIPKFGQLFFEALQKYFGEVKYDENGQLMSFTPKLAEHFLERLYTTLTESKSLSLCQIVEELDFVGTMQNVASTEQIKFVKRKKIIPIKVNGQFLKLLFSLAFGLSLQIERSELSAKYLKAFGTAYNRIELKEVLGSHSFFAFKINILHKMVEIKLPNWKLPDYMQVENINKLMQQKVRGNFKILFSLSNCTPTLYEILKMAKQLGKIELSKDDANKYKIWLNSSDSKIIFEFMKYLKSQLGDDVEKIEIVLENDFCFLAHFVENLLEEMATANKIPKIESIKFAIGNFISVKEELCKKKAIENDANKYFDENLVNFNKAINTDFSPHNELLQIVPEIIAEIEQMLQKNDWNYAYLNDSKMVEWNLLENGLYKIENDQKWKEIEQLRGEWKKAFNDRWESNQNEKNRPIEEIMENLIQILRGFIMQQIVPEIVAEIEQMLQKNDWNYAYLNDSKIVEWNLLENGLHKTGNDQKWEEIEQLRGKWKKVHNKWYKPISEKMMENLIKMLRGIDLSGEAKVQETAVLQATKRAKIA
ncbi:hypothetical protein GPALN_010413 [Globodera pallida]|nr:hypothetical protein GPALN_010413 [Globodera pallida]